MQCINKLYLSANCNPFMCSCTWPLLPVLLLTIIHNQYFGIKYYPMTHMSRRQCIENVIYHNPVYSKVQVVIYVTQRPAKSLGNKQYHTPVCTKQREQNFGRISAILQNLEGYMEGKGHLRPSTHMACHIKNIRWTKRHNNQYYAIHFKL